MYTKEDVQNIITEAEKYIFPQRENMFKKAVSSMINVYQDYGVDVAKDVLQTLKILNKNSIAEARDFWLSKISAYKGEHHYVAPIKIFATKIICNSSKNGEDFYKAVYIDGKQNVDVCVLNNHKALSERNARFKNGTATEADNNSRNY